jgi:hypothetical protein
MLTNGDFSDQIHVISPFFKLKYYKAMVFAPIVIAGENSNSPLWWWRFYAKRHGFAGYHSHRLYRKTYFRSWNEAISGDGRSQTIKG